MSSPIPRSGRCTTSTVSTAKAFRRADQAVPAATEGSRTATLILTDLILAADPARRGAGANSLGSSDRFSAAGRVGGRGGAGGEPARADIKQERALSLCDRAQR